MDALFINKFKHSKENIIEMNKAYSRKSIIISKILVLISFFLLSLIWCFDFQNLLVGILIALIGIAVTFIPSISTSYKASKNEKRLVLLYNKIPEVTTFFNDDNIFSVTEENKGELSISYDKIIKIKQSKNLYLLILKEKLVIMVDKKRFTKGSCEEFEKFIKEKAINAKIKL